MRKFEEWCGKAWREIEDRTALRLLGIDPDQENEMAVHVSDDMQERLRRVTAELESRAPARAWIPLVVELPRALTQPECEILTLLANTHFGALRMCDLKHWVPDEQALEFLFHIGALQRAVHLEGVEIMPLGMALARHRQDEEDRARNEKFKAMAAMKDIISTSPEAQEAAREKLGSLGVVINDPNGGR